MGEYPLFSISYAQNRGRGWRTEVIAHLVGWEHRYDEHNIARHTHDLHTSVTLLSHPQTYSSATYSSR